MKEEHAYEIIKELVAHGGNRHRAALTLGCSKRSVDRHIAGYRAQGKAYFVHGNSGKAPAHALGEDVRRDIADLYLGKYSDANFAHFTEMAQNRDNLSVSESTVRNILGEHDILSPKATRRTKRALKTKLKAQLSQAKTKKEAEGIQARLVEAEDAHPRRPRRSHFGEMIQMDASLHPWFGSHRATLHVAVDDATGMIVGAWFDTQETLQGYYNVFRQILTDYGIPYMFYTDRRTVFEYRKSGSTDTADDSFTQFSYACKQFGVQIETTSVPQAKGRVERLNQTLQSRLPVELRLEGATTLEQANDYLPRFIADYNARFALPPHSTPSVFETQPSPEQIDLTLAVIAERTVDAGHAVRFDNKFFRTLDKNGAPRFFLGGTKGLVIRSFSGRLFFSAQDCVSALEEIPPHEHSSKNFGEKTAAATPRKPYIPPASHPWRLSSFSSFTRKLPYHPA